MVNSGVLTWIIVTLLFSIWHLGYLDVFLIHHLGHANLTMILVSKMGIGIVLGSIVGYLRLKTGKTYAPIFSTVYGMYLHYKSLLNFYSIFFIALINFL